MSTVTPLPEHGSDFQVIAREIRAWTARRGKRQTDVARAIKMDPAQYSRRLNGQSAMKVHELLAIARVLDVDVGVFSTPSVDPWPNGRPDGPDDDGPGRGSRGGDNQAALDRLAQRKRRLNDDDGGNHRYAA